MNTQNNEAKEPKISRRLLMELNGPRFDRHSMWSAEVHWFARKHRNALVISILSLLLAWQWHAARMATQRAEMAERDMQLNARQAIQLSDAVLQAQAAHDRLERKIVGNVLPEPR